MAEPASDLDHARYDRDRWMDAAMKAQQRLIEISAELAAERQTATLNAETHTLKIRALEDMVEAEAEARREAEGECARLTERLEIKVAALRSEIAAKVTAQQYGAALEEENARLRIAFHDAIRRPLGVTPDSGTEFYDQRMADEAEQKRPRAWPDETVWVRY